MCFAALVTGRPWVADFPSRRQSFAPFSRFCVPPWPGEGRRWPIPRQGGKVLPPFPAFSCRLGHRKALDGRFPVKAARAWSRSGAVALQVPALSVAGPGQLCYGSAKSSGLAPLDALRGRFAFHVRTKLQTCHTTDPDLRRKCPGPAAQLASTGNGPHPRLRHSQIQAPGARKRGLG